jgi:hypothetical protein
MTRQTGQKITLAEVEDRAKRIIRTACPDEMMEIESLATCPETGRVFVVLRCLEVAGLEKE